MPRETETHSLMMISGKQIGGPRLSERNQDGHGMTKSEDFFLNSGFRTHVVATIVCATGVYTHSVSHAHFLCIFFLAWRTGTNTHGSRCLQCVCHISPSRPLRSHVSSAVFAVPARSLRHHVPVCTVFVELYQTQMRRSSATARAPGSLASWPIPRT